MTFLLHSYIHVHVDGTYLKCKVRYLPVEYKVDGSLCPHNPKFPPASSYRSTTKNTYMYNERKCFQQDIINHSSVWDGYRYMSFTNMYLHVDLYHPLG